MFAPLTARRFAALRAKVAPKAHKPLHRLHSFVHLSYLITVLTENHHAHTYAVLALLVVVALTVALDD